MIINATPRSIVIHPDHVDLLRGGVVIDCMTRDEWIQFVEAVKAADLESWPKSIAAYAEKDAG